MSARRQNIVADLVRQLMKELDITWHWIAAGAGLVALTSAFMLVVWIHDERYAQNGPGDFRGAHLAQTADGRPVIVVGAVVDYNDLSDGGNQIYQPRLHAIDPATGEELARVRVEHPRQCVPAVAGLVWCDINLTSGSQLELRDAATLELRKAYAQVTATAPALSRQSWPAIDVRTGEAWLPTSDGRFWRVHPQTLQGTLENIALVRDRVLGVGSGGSPLSGSARLESGTLYFEGSPRKIMMRSDGRGTYEQISPNDTFLDPQFILEHEGPARADWPPMTLEGGDVFLITHGDSVDRNTAKLLLSAVTLAGKRRWTTTLEHGELRAAWLLDRVLVLAIAREAQGTLVGLDPSDGRVKWERGT